MRGFILIYLKITIPIFIIGLISYVIYYSIKGKPNSLIVDNSKTKKNKKEEKLKKFSSLYTGLTKVPILGEHLTSLKKRLYLNTAADEIVLREKTIRIFFISVVSTIIGSLLCIRLFGTDLYAIGVIILFALYVNNAVINMLIPTETKLLKEMIEFLKEVKHKYHLHHMVSDSVYEATAKAPYMMNIQGKRLYEVLNSPKEEDFDKYNLNCPNEFLRLFLGICTLTKKYGDGITEDGKSKFVKQLNFLIDEIKTEILKRDKLQYRLSSLSTIAMVPAFLARPLEAWLVTNFDTTAPFYVSSKGFVARIAILFTSYFSYFLIKEIEKQNARNSKLLVKDKHWEETALKFKPLKSLIDKQLPAQKTKKFFKIRDLIEQSGTFLKPEWLYLRKNIALIATFLILVSVVITYHQISYNSIKNNADFGLARNASYQKLKGTGSKQRQKQFLDTVEIDKQVIQDVKQGYKFNKNNVAHTISLNKNLNESEKEAVLERITLKLKALQEEHFKFWELLIILLLSKIGMNIPVFLLMFQKHIRKAQLEEEVYQFNTIILLLREFKSVSIPMILEWMEKFSDIYYNPIKKCSNNLQMGMVKALEQLQKDVSYPAFVRLVDNLIAAEDITIKKAFDSLETEREFYKDERKEMNERIIARKTNVGKFIGMIPTMTLLTGYLVVPMVLTSFQQLNELMIQLSKTN